MFQKEWWFYTFAQHNWWWLILVMIILVVITSVMNDNVRDSSLKYFISFGIAVILRGICSFVTITAIIFVIFGHTFAIDNVNMKDIKGLNIQVESNKVVIDKLPDRYKYEKLDNDKELKSNMKQQFKYEVNEEFNTSYLVSEDGGKIKLNEEDTKFLKERGVK